MILGEQSVGQVRQSFSLKFPWIRMVRESRSGSFDSPLLVPRSGLAQDDNGLGLFLRQSEKTNMSCFWMLFSCASMVFKSDLPGSLRRSAPCDMLPQESEEFAVDLVGVRPGKAVRAAFHHNQLASVHHRGGAPAGGVEGANAI